MAEVSLPDLCHRLAQGIDWLMSSHPQLLAMALTGCVLWLLTRRG